MLFESKIPIKDIIGQAIDFCKWLDFTCYDDKVEKEAIRLMAELIYDYEKQIKSKN